MSKARPTRAGQTAGLGARTIAPSDHEAVTNAATGFPNRTDTTLSFVAGTRTFTITPASGAFSYYIAGRRYIVSAADSIVIADTSGHHAIYYNGATLSVFLNPDEDEYNDLMLNTALVGVAYWNATDGASIVSGDDRHGEKGMSARTHEWIHNAIGTVWAHGLDVSGYTLDTDTDNGVDFEVTDGEIYDEDVDHEITDGNPAVQYEQQLSAGDAEVPILYRDDVDGSWTEDAATTLPYKRLGAGRLAYNNDDGDGTWSQVEVGNNQFVLATLIATNDWAYPIKMVQGQDTYATRAAALDAAETEQVAWGDMPSPEIVVLYRFLMQTNNGFGGTNKCKIIEIFDQRRLTLTGGAAAAPAPHAILSNTHSDSVAAAVVQGDIIVGNATPEWERFPIGKVDDVLASTGTAPLWTPHLAVTSDPHGATMTVTTSVITPVVQNAGDLHLDALDASAHATVYVENTDGTFEADLNVERNIIVGGTVDGIDIAGTVVTADANLTDDALVRGKGGALGAQTSLAILSDAGALSALTQLDVDNLRLDGNTISNTGGTNVNITPQTGEDLACNVVGTSGNDESAWQIYNYIHPAAADTRTTIAFFQATTAGGVGVGIPAGSGKITVGTEGAWAAAAGTQDSYMAFFTALNGDNAAAEKMRITSTGVVGINTTDPAGLHASAMLDIRKDALCALAIYTFAGTAVPGTLVTTDSRVFAARARGVDGTPLIVHNGDSLFTFQSLGYNGAGYTTGAIITFAVDGVPGVGAMPAAIVFKTAPGAPVERLRIQSDGDILVDSGTSVFVRDSALGFNSSADGQLDLFADTEVEITAPTIELAASTHVLVSTLVGIDYGTGADADMDLMTVLVTGTPRQWWDESEDAFVMTHRLDLTAGGVQTVYAVDDVADPPTDAELDTAFGDPTVVGPGFVGILDDGGAGLYCYICWTTGTAGEWFYLAGTKAV